ARFIGTPPMNVLRLAGKSEHLIGVRPEDMRFADAGLPIRVTSVEFLGADSIVTCAAGGESLAVRVAGRVELAEGKSAHVTWTPEAQHLFDPDTGKRVDTGDDPMTSARAVAMALALGLAMLAGAAGAQQATEITFYYPIAVG